MALRFNIRYIVLSTPAISQYWRIQVQGQQSLNEHTYKHPVILEAVFELRFETVKAWGITSFVEFARLAKEKGYPVLKDAAQSFQVIFPLSSSGAPTMTPISNRVQTWNEAETQLWQASPEMFAANRRTPYEGWVAFLPHILVGLELYRKVAEPEKAEAMKLQFINRIEVDVRQNSPADLVRFLPPEIQYGDRVNNFVCRTDQAFRDGGQIAVTTTRDMSAANGVAIVLDVLYVTPNPNLEPGSLMSTIEIAHGRVLSAFENSITNVLRERMKPVC
jgi:uncharacterized protein (TIGR04255 family)